MGTIPTFPVALVDDTVVQLFHDFCYYVPTMQSNLESWDAASGNTRFLDLFYPIFNDKLRVRTYPNDTTTNGLPDAVNPGDTGMDVADGCYILILNDTFGEVTFRDGSGFIEKAIGTKDESDMFGPVSKAWNWNDSAYPGTTTSDVITGRTRIGTKNYAGLSGYNAQSVSGGLYGACGAVTFECSDPAMDKQISVNFSAPEFGTGGSGMAFHDNATRSENETLYKTQAGTGNGVGRDWRHTWPDPDDPTTGVQLSARASSMAHGGGGGPNDNVIVIAILLSRTDL